MFSAFAAGERRGRGALVITAVDTERGAPPQVAYAVGRGIGHAPARNRLRRRLRHVMRAREEQLEDGRAYLVSASAPAAELSFEQVDASIGSLLSELARAKR